ncbi:MAG: hypothetical protein AB8B56_12855 [Crocinitomicaceae bacterium]
MRNSLKCVVLLSTAFLISCGSQQNFSSRKYTKGKFRVANKRMKSSTPELKQEQAFAEADFQEKYIDREYLIQPNLQEENERTLSETISLDEVTPTVPVLDGNEVQVESSSTASSLTVKHERKPRSEIDETRAKKDKEKKNKKDLTASQRKARSSMIWGIVAASLAIALITLTMVSFSGMIIPYGFLLIGRSMRIALIPAIVGIVQSTIAQFGNEDLGKYEKHRKVGFWLCISTLLLWVLLA